MRIAVGITAHCRLFIQAHFWSSCCCFCNSAEWLGDLNHLALHRRENKTPAISRDTMFFALVRFLDKWTKGAPYRIVRSGGKIYENWPWWVWWPWLWTLITAWNIGIVEKNLNSLSARLMINAPNETKKALLTARGCFAIQGFDEKLRVKLSKSWGKVGIQ